LALSPVTGQLQPMLQALFLGLQLRVIDLDEQLALLHPRALFESNLSNLAGGLTRELHRLVGPERTGGTNAVGDGAGPEHRGVNAHRGVIRSFTSARVVGAAEFGNR
jgi:hypothetical protein